MLKKPTEDAGSGPSADTLFPIQARQVRIERAGRTLLDVADFTVPQDGTLAVLGHNGAGKSLLLKVLAGLQAPDQGRVTWAGHPPDRVRTLRLGFVLQRPVLLRRSVLDNVKYPLALSGLNASQQHSRAAAKLRHWGLDHLSDVPARVLSGGEQRRVAIARALVTKPDCLFLDEPAAHLDLEATRAIESMIGTVRAAGVPVVIVTHDIGQTRRLADTIVFMDHGRILEQTPSTAFFEAPQSPEARAFLAGRID